jgi:hypothetical protein
MSIINQDDTESKVKEEYLFPDDFGDKNESNLKQRFVGFLESPWWFVTIIILVIICAFSIGRISAIENNKEPVRVIQNKPVPNEIVDTAKQPAIDQNNRVQAASPVLSDQIEATPVPSDSGQVVASKSGKKYHYPWCGGAKQIAEKNKIAFSSIEEARAAGYTPAANCKGLK